MGEIISCISPEFEMNSFAPLAQRAKLVDENRPATLLYTVEEDKAGMKNSVVTLLIRES